MKRASTSYSLTYWGFTFLALLLAGCSLEKESGFNRTMQNLTAHYNILFNANELLRQKQEVYQTSYIDAYNQLLSVYQDTTAHPNNAVDKELEAAIAKANTIISVKEQSHYIGDAYLLLGKANHLYGHYFNAVEFFRYVTMSFPKQKLLVQEARVWQARSSIYLNQMEQAKVLIDSTLKNVNPKKSITADVYGTALQYHMDMGEYPEAEAMAKLAVKYANTKQQRLRLTFILSQLQELNREQQDAYLNYTKVVKSNASFEMAFNADLNRIRLEDERANRNLTRMERLRRLLRDDKNVEFTDQIYYQIALLYLAGNDIDNAIKNLQLSIRYSTKNQNQKGISYLRLADISFKNQGNYVKAKKYYDSTLMNLSPSYPDYTLIQKKSNNLQVLADRLYIIGHEDTLQNLARLDEKDRAARIEEMVTRHNLQLQAAASPTDPLNNAYSNSIAAGGSSATGISSFYFYNSASIANGFTSFKRVWGNRKLEDNWRRSKHISGDPATSTATQFTNTDPDAVPMQNKKTVDEVITDNYKQDLMQNLPLTPQKLDLSNQKVYNAYTDIANFYRDILGDKNEAIESYQTLLTRYPNDPNKPAVFYSLYRLYFETGNAVRANEYKNKVLNEYPSSLYAQVIKDPDYSRRLDDKDATFNLMYNQVYDLYAKRKYADVISKADSLLRVYPGSKFAAQLAYLRTIAKGHQEKFDPFRSELLAVTETYPNDRLITPLVNQHIVYLEENKAKMSAREFALMDNDPSEEPFIPAAVPSQPIVKAPVQVQPQQKPVVQNQQPVKQTTIPPTNNSVTQPVTPPVSNPVVNNNPVTPQPVSARPASADPVNTPPVPVVKSIFNLRDSTNYYFVVNVSTGTVNLSSSRFGIGQFNRANYQGTGIAHQLKNAGADNQLVYVGHFSSLTAVKNYARAIIPLMPQIMKVPVDKYTFFIITQENLDKLADKKTLDSYIDFYQKNY